MNFIIIEIGSITNIGLNGAILQILSHEFIGATLFLALEQAREERNRQERREE